MQENDSKRIYLVTIITAVIIISVVAAVTMLQKSNSSAKETIKVGFIYDSDESTPYTANFIKAQKTMERKLGDRVEVIVMNNIPVESGAEAEIRELVAEGCDIIFTTSYGYGETAKQIASEHTDVQFCEATCDNANTDPVLSNYHTFMGEIYQGRYISGVVAGLKLKEMIDKGVITTDEAKVGYVGAYETPEVISGYTAFLLGIRSEVPEAVMEVKYTNTWSAYAVEYQCAKDLIDDGCYIISQHSDTLGPAVACEETYSDRRVYHVGYNQSMIDVAPTTSLISCRIDWEPYITAACEAVLEDKPIEEYVRGKVHGSCDLSAGFDEGWIVMSELNSLIAAEGSETQLNYLTNKFKNGSFDVFKGNYTGTAFDDPKETIDLNDGFKENEDSSAPGFKYILDDVITVVK